MIITEVELIAVAEQLRGGVLGAMCRTRMYNNRVMMCHSYLPGGHEQLVMVVKTPHLHILLHYKLPQ